MLMSPRNLLATQLNRFPISPIHHNPSTMVRMVTGIAVAQYSHWPDCMSRMSLEFIPKTLETALRGKKMMVTMVKA